VVARKLTAILLLLVCTACASLGLEPAKSFDARLAYAYSTVASVRQSAAQALTTGVIKVEDAKQVQSLADQARSLLDASRGAYSVGDTKTALGRLQLANSVLTQLAVYLQQRGVK
jgi:sensor histidine kinase regulating citrate/malate metabolism